MQKNSAALYKITGVKSSFEIKGGCQEMAAMVKVDGKILIKTIQVNLCRLIPACPQNSHELLLSKFLPST